MKEQNLSPWHQSVQEVMETTIKSIRDAVQAKAVVVIILHADGTSQMSASVRPSNEITVATVLKSTAETLLKGGSTKIEMSDRTKN
jgi:aspartate aminotransferase-like enzyme